ncbi:hypothetical protein PI125_g20481 [Phytophthora idaei]|nr:hypothetical protein PI125_g20481 [Phytophthora idaei]
MKFTTIVRAGVFISALAATLTRGYTFSETGDLSTNSATQESTGLTVNEESRIYGGSEADASKCPYIVSLRKDEADGSTYCGGTLIASHSFTENVAGSTSEDKSSSTSTDTTDAPSTESPATKTPTTEVPTTTFAPTTKAPTAATPTAAPSTEAPTPAPTVTEAPGTDAPQTESPTTDSEDAYAPSTDSAEQKEPSSNPAQQSEPNATEAPTSASGIKTQRGKKDCSTLF